MWWTALMLGCGDGSSQVADRKAYLDSLDAPPVESRAACLRIGDDTTREECLLQVASRTSNAGDREQAEATCDAMVEGPWREECWFLVVDQLNLFDDEAVAFCDRAGRFRSNCLGHAYSRDVSHRLGRVAVGQERQWLAHARDKVRTYYPSATAGKVDQLAYDMLARELRARWLDADFDMDLCGQALGRGCRQAYEGSVVMPGSTPDALNRLCAGPRTVDLAREVGVRPWKPTSDDFVQGVLERLCAQQGRGG